MQHLFPTVLEIEVQDQDADMIGLLVRALFPLYRWPPPSCFSHGREKGLWSLSLLIIILISAWGLHFHNLSTSQRPHLQIPSHWD